MASWLAPAALGAVYALGACLAWDLLRANLRHGHHEAARLAPVVVGEGDPRFGSMSLVEETQLHHDRRVRTPGGMLLEYDWSGKYEVIETAPGEPLRAWSHPTDPAWPSPPFLAAPPSEAEVAASRAAHGYIPELDPGPEAGCVRCRNLDGTITESCYCREDPGPEAAAPAPGPDQRLCCPEQPQERPAPTVGGHGTCSPGNENGDRDTYVLGPRARAVLDGYEGRLGARKWACT